MSAAILTAIMVTSAYPSCDPNATPYQAESMRPVQVVVYGSPCYDCYSHHRQQLDCYPTFYQRHYRRPYNYRTLSDYPWHADLYRPTCTNDAPIEVIDVPIDPTNAQVGQGRHLSRAYLKADGLATELAQQRWPDHHAQNGDIGVYTPLPQDPRIKRLGASTR